MRRSTSRIRRALLASGACLVGACTALVSESDHPGGEDSGTCSSQGDPCTPPIVTEFIDAGPPDAGPPDASSDPDGGWRSALFPKGWLPLHAGGDAGPAGRFLPDFSYAGYRRGERSAPHGLGAVVATVDASLGDGGPNATPGIQAAINAACAADGGVVRIPAGTYRLTLPSATATEALLVGCSGVVVRGDGPSSTRLLFDDASRARNKSVIALRASGAVSTGTYLLAEDTPGPTVNLRLASAVGLTPGTPVTVRNDVTAAFRAEHRMDQPTSGQPGLWPSNQFSGLAYHRRIVRVTGDRVELDAPLHYPLQVRDNARLLVRGPLVEESGVESLAIGMVENRATLSRTEPASDMDYETAGTTGYEVHNSRAVTVDRAQDVWLYDVDTFLPPGNQTGAHLLSHGVQISPGASRVTVERCDFGRPQYRGGGGNGYIFHLQGHDALVVDSSSTAARHGISMNQATAGNVFLRLRLDSSRFSDDTHRFLSHANLFDGVRLDRAWLQSVNRGTTSGGGGFTGTQLVFWNPYVLRGHSSARGCAVESAQWGHGYLVGSSAADGGQALLCPRSFSNSGWSQLDQGDPADHVEGEGQGATLIPRSLYEGQRALRCAREGLSCEP